MILLALSGCAATPVNEVPVGLSEAEIMLKEVKSDWLAPCAGLGDLPDHQVGSLLQDFVNASTLGATCQARHNSLVSYLTPLIVKLQQDPIASPP